jgi:hypothetical protein
MAPRKQKLSANVSRYFADGLTNREIRDLYSSRAQNANVTEEDMQRDFGDPDYFDDRRGDTATYNAFRYVNYADVLGRQYSLDDPTPSDLASGAATVAPGQVIRLKYRIGKTLNTRARLLSSASETVVSHPATDEIIMLTAQTVKNASFQLPNIAISVRLNDSDPDRSTGILDAAVLNSV